MNAMDAMDAMAALFAVTTGCFAAAIVAVAYAIGRQRRR
jgi:hypothetical protein